MLIHLCLLGLIVDLNIQSLHNEPRNFLSTKMSKWWYSLSTQWWAINITGRALLRPFTFPGALFIPSLHAKKPRRLKACIPVLYATLICQPPHVRPSGSNHEESEHGIMIKTECHSSRCRHDIMAIDWSSFLPRYLLFLRSRLHHLLDVMFVSLAEAEPSLCW